MSEDEDTNGDILRGLKFAVILVLKFAALIALFAWIAS